jgi:hypothetical protein
MLKRGRAELVLCFLLGIAVFAFYEAIASFQASNCSYQEHEKRDTEPGHPNASAQEQRKDRSEQKNNAAVSEPFACTFFGAPTALRVFMNHNEGFFVGGFTFLLVFVTGWLVRATIKLWRGAEDTAQRQLRAYVTSVFGNAGRQGITKGFRFEFRPSIVNTGQTPAYNLHADVGIKWRRGMAQHSTFLCPTRPRPVE